MELIDYVRPKGPLPEVTGKGDLLVMGGAAGVWDDLRAYDQRHGQQDRMAVNHIMLFYPGRLQWGVTLHTNMMPAFTYLQWYKGAREGWPPMKTHSHRPGEQVDHVWPLAREGGTGGLFAAVIGLLMGYKRIILAGIPCDSSRHFWEPTWTKSSHIFCLQTCYDEWQRWRDEVPIFKERVRSLSGNTREILGAPS